MLSSMIDALMCEYEGFDTAQDMWIVLKDKFGGTSTTKLRRLTIKFDTYKKRQNHDMRQHLREMSNMIRELKSAGHTLTDEQQIQAVIRSLPNSWENMKINMTHNDNIKTFDDISRHVELEDERLEAAKASGQLYMAESSKRKTKGFKRKGKNGNFQKGNSQKGKWKGPTENFKKSETKFQKRGKSAGCCHVDEVVFDDAPIGFYLEQSPNVGAFVVEHEKLASKDVGPLNEASSWVEVKLL
ncbi:hypothetical protein LWI29_021811 [Acer saccharum]|uniref:Uncharacterized protein n=1 Tax=Acer saccharum TaxID=4024 RepID=A0AA39S2P4_ACESA|nr:hypothetical protein LWI29_021811 [Acer saccharum]